MFIQNKVCKSCGITKSIGDFSKNSNGMKDGHLNQCKKCVIVRLKKWKENNQLLVKERRKKEYVKNKDYYIKSAVVWGKNNKEKRIVSKSKWVKKNRKKLCHYSKIRSYREKGAVGSHSEEEWDNLVINFRGKCAYCNKNKGNTRDHVIPISKGGSNYIENILPACTSCNSSKRDKLLKDWLNT